MMHHTRMSLSRFLYSSTAGVIRSRLVMARPFSTRGDLKDQILKRRKESSLTSALDLFEELVSKETNKEQAIDSTLSVLIHFCEREEDRVGGEEVMAMIHRHCSDPSTPLATAIMKYLLAIKERERVWSCYDKYMKNAAMREKLSLKLLQLAVDDKNVERVKELLEKYNHGNIDDDLIQSLMELAVEEDRSGGREWRNIGYTLMDKLSANEAMINDSTAMCIIKWLRSMWGGEGHISINDTSINNNGICRSCGRKIKDNKLTKSERSSLLQHTKAMLLKEPHEYENGKSEEKEIKIFLKICETKGPFGVIIDGLNILLAGGPNASQHKYTRKFVSLCNWSVQHRPLPALVIGRAHMRSIIKNMTNKMPENVHFFYTSNRVSDDLYFMYGSLSSGKDTLFVTNDRLGDHLQNIDKPLIPIFQKWLRSSCVTHDELPHWRGLQLPRPYDVRIQWTDDDCWHIPTADDSWYCVKRI